MPAHVIVWDLETVPDLQGYAAANDFDGNSDDEVRAAFKAGVRPSRIARQFGISLSDVRKALAGGEKK